MTPIKFIMTQILAISNAEMASLMDVSREAVSHWRSGKYAPDMGKLRPILKAFAAQRGLPWDDAWLFEVPVCDECTGLDACGQGCARVGAACAEVRASHDLGLERDRAAKAARSSEALVAGLSNGKPEADFPPSTPAGPDLSQAGRGQSAHWRGAFGESEAQS